MGLMTIETLELSGRSVFNAGKKPMQWWFAFTLLSAGRKWLEHLHVAVLRHVPV